MLSMMLTAVPQESTDQVSRRLIGFLGPHPGGVAVTHINSNLLTPIYRTHVRSARGIFNLFSG
jgi:Na+-transporting NADH:ubiquinone oxidoreductase subunit NqrA